MMIKMNKNLILVQNKSIISKIKEVDKATFLFPLEGYSVGYPVTFKELFRNFPKNIKGIVFEDLGVIDLVKDLDITKILWQNHLNNSYLSVNGFLKYVDSVMVSTDITEEEIKLIISKADKPLTLYVFGYVPVMYSRRHLVSNFNLNYNEP